MSELTKDMLRPLFITICSMADNVDAISVAFEDEFEAVAERVNGVVNVSDEEKVKLIEQEFVGWFVDQILTDKVVDYINSHMKRYYVVECNTEGNEVSWVMEHAQEEARTLGHPHMLAEEGPESVFPMVGEYPAFLIADRISSLGGGMHGVLYCFRSETFITSDGRIVAADAWDYTYTKHDENDYTPDLTIRCERNLGDFDFGIGYVRRIV